MVAGLHAGASPARSSSDAPPSRAPAIRCAIRASAPSPWRSSTSSRSAGRTASARSGHSISQASSRGRRVEAELQQLRGILDPVEVDVADHQIGKAIVLDQRVAGARHLDLGAGARPEQRPGELGLARPERAAQRDHVAGPEQSGKAPAEIPGRRQVAAAPARARDHRTALPRRAITDPIARAARSALARKSPDRVAAAPPCGAAGDLSSHRSRARPRPPALPARARPRGRARGSRAASRAPRPAPSGP